MEVEELEKCFQLGAEAEGGDASRRCAFQVMRRQNRDFLFLPLDRRAARAGLELYAPQTRVARLAVASVGCLIAFGGPRVLVRRELGLCANGILGAFLRKVCDGPVAGDQLPVMAILLGNPSIPGSRFVILMFDEQGLPSAVCKVGCGEAAESLRHESRLLSKLKSNPVVPRVRARQDGEGMSLLAMDFYPSLKFKITWPYAELGSCLEGWMSPHETVQLAETEPWSQLASRARGEDEERGLLDRLGTRMVPLTLGHGDFAPWNIRASRGGGTRDDVRIIDWERGHLRGIPCWDWFHYTYQHGHLVDRQPAVVLARRLYQLTQTAGFSAYAQRAAVAGIKVELLHAYLLYVREILSGGRANEAAGEVLRELRRVRLESVSGAGGIGARSYGECWEKRGREGFFLTEHVGYRIGAALASLASRTSLTPNGLSLASLLLGVGGVFAVLTWVNGAIWQGLGLLLVTLAAYGLDCADGVLARVTGRTSKFGALLDKFVDWQRNLITLSLLYFYAPPSQMSSLAPGVVSGAFVLMLMTRSGLALSFWLQDLLWKDKPHRAPKAEARALTTHPRRSLGIVVDEVFYIFVAGVGWMMALFWEIMLVYGLILSLVTAAYLADLKRRMMPHDA